MLKFFFTHRRRTPPIRDPKPGPTLPNLPAELWVQIIHEATAITPDPLDTTKAISFLASPQCTLQNYITSMRLKCILSLISKAWYSYTQEVLYEFVWICRAGQAKALANTLIEQARWYGKDRQSGIYMHRLHIATPTLDRCSPADLAVLVDLAPNLHVYSDNRSIRRNLWEEECDPTISPNHLFSALAHPNNSLRWLSWTNYNDVSFYLHMSPMLRTTAAHLEYLELTFCSPHMHSVFAGADPSSTPAPPPASRALTLPSLRSLKVTLDNATFAVLATWSMPALTNLSVISADFSYAGVGFSQFFRIHGHKIKQLELGHSSSMIEEHYLTTPPTQQHFQPHIPLADWCPNLREFICSADAEWNWQNPDWIAPHVLLPTHPSVELIGIRDIDKRLVDDASVSPNAPLADPSPFFPLLMQISSLIGIEDEHLAAFPKLRYIRDLSWESDNMRTHKPESRVIKFWQEVLMKCKSRGVWLEDCNGFNVTRRSLQRAQMGQRV